MNRTRRTLALTLGLACMVAGPAAAASPHKTSEREADVSTVEAMSSPGGEEPSIFGPLFCSVFIHLC